MKSVKMIQVLDKTYLGRHILGKIIAKEGGEKYSETLRRQFAERKVNVGMYTYGGCFSKSFNIGGTVNIGRYCSFAGNVSYFGGNHPMNYVSMSLFFIINRGVDLTLRILRDVH